MENTDLDNMLYTTVDRVKQFIKFKKISLRKFAEIIGASHSLINNTKSLGSDKLESILVNYPELNPVWLLTGKGNMLFDQADALTDTLQQGSALAVLQEQLQLLKALNQSLLAHLADKERLIKILEDENKRLQAL
ncbi:hypothetical protein [Flavobacterium sp. JP2137]|uniref:hypothetical protein n=1 Tax=Flavobacterium sp. JP2137 TaxID=3414510 RepID=UPI003D2FCD5F